MTATRLIRIDCDGPICRPDPVAAAEILGDDSSVGSLGGGYVVLAHGPLDKVRRVLADSFGWGFDRDRKADLCPRCVAASTATDLNLALAGAGPGVG